MDLFYQNNTPENRLDDEAGAAAVVAPKLPKDGVELAPKLPKAEVPKELVLAAPKAGAAPKPPASSYGHAKREFSNARFKTSALGVFVV